MPSSAAARNSRSLTAISAKTSVRLLNAQLVRNAISRWVVSRVALVMIPPLALVTGANSMSVSEPLSCTVSRLRVWLRATAKRSSC